MNVEKGFVDAPVEKDIDLKKEIEKLKKEKDAVVLAHYYQKGEIQDVADFSVHFMGETAKILCPDKKVVVPDVNAGCSLADSCPAEEFEAFIRERPGATVVSYVNTSAAVKALTDVVVTSSNARQIVEQLPEDAHIIFGPDRNLGNYINSVTGRNMDWWNGACHVHEQFSLDKIVALKKEHPGAKLLVHPECRRSVVLLADKVGSRPARRRHPPGMMKKCPGKTFIPAPPEDSTCACNDCNFMKLNTLEKLYNSLKYELPEITVDPAVAEAAIRPIERMLAMS